MNRVEITERLESMRNEVEALVRETREMAKSANVMAGTADRGHPMADLRDELWKLSADLMDVRGRVMNALFISLPEVGGTR